MGEGEGERERDPVDDLVVDLSFFPLVLSIEAGGGVVVFLPLRYSFLCCSCLAAY